MIKYKPGDKIVLCNPDITSINDGFKKGQKFVIAEVNVNDRMISVKNGFIFYTEEIMLAEVYNSPLYKALNEEE